MVQQSEQLYVKLVRQYQEKQKKRHSKPAGRLSMGTTLYCDRANEGQQSGCTGEASDQGQARNRIGQPIMRPLSIPVAANQNNVS